MVKKELIRIEMVIDKPGLISKKLKVLCYATICNSVLTSPMLSPVSPDGVASEVSLHHSADARRFLNTDETHHKFSNESEKGGTRARRYANPSFSRSGDRIIKNSRHTTGCYTTTAAGEALPPLFILDSSAKFEENYKIDPRICIGLPCVTLMCELGKPTLFSSFVSVRKKGSMDSSLWPIFMEQVILKCFGNTVSRKIV